MKKLILDFNNDKITFDEKQFIDYNFNVIEDNIETYRKFAYELTINKNFDDIFESMVFQITFSDINSNYVENLVAVYNAIASNKLVNGKQYSQIDEDSFIAQMKLRGWEAYKTKLTINKNEYRFVKRFRKQNSFIWE